MIDYLGMVRDFHRLYGHAEGKEGPVGLVQADVEALRRRLMEEELQETLEAIDRQDVVGIADGLADLLYVVFGTCVSYGIPMDEVFAIVHSANMRKVGPDGIPMRDAGGKTMKPPGWVPPEEEIKECLLRHRRKERDGH